MGQSPPDPVQLETRVENPTGGSPPAGLAVIQHGRLGGTFDQPIVRRLAEYFCGPGRLRVVTWNERGVGASAPIGAEWWFGDTARHDYNRMLSEAMAAFGRDFPDVRDAHLFICGYSAGGVFAGCARPSAADSGPFRPPRYVLVSYPVNLIPGIGLSAMSGLYFRAVEALVSGHGYEDGLAEEFGGVEPPVEGVLTVTGGEEAVAFYWVWQGILREKEKHGNRQGTLTQVVVPGAGHGWEGDMARKVVEEIELWLATL